MRAVWWTIVLLASEVHLLSATESTSNEVQQHLAECLTKDVLLNQLLNGTADFRFVLNSTLSDVIGSLNSKSEALNTFFTDSLKQSKRELHLKFIQSYGIFYEPNSHVFLDMMADLERYYAFGAVDLKQTIDSSFVKLYQTMFKSINSQYVLDDRYLNCASNEMDRLKPFGDLPSKLTNHLKSILISGRGLVQALKAAANIVSSISQVPISRTCRIELVEMLYHRDCSKKDECASHCVKVMEFCMSGYLGMDMEWNTFIDNIIALSQKLSGFLIYGFADDMLDTKLFEAIKTFQASARDITNHVFNACGKPRVQKRSVSIENPSLGENGGWNAADLEKLSDELKASVVTYKTLWSDSPKNLCQKFARKNHKDYLICGNGSYFSWRTYKGTVDGGVPSLEKKIEALKEINIKLIRAFNGLDVDWEKLEISEAVQPTLGIEIGTEDIVTELWNHQTSKKVFEPAPHEPSRSNRVRAFSLIMITTLVVLRSVGTKDRL